MTVIRELIDGGFSPCNSPEEMVGKGRCNHILGSDKKPTELIHESRNQYSAKIEENPEVKENKKSIKNFVDNLPKIPEQKQLEIINEFMNAGGV